MIIKKIYIDKFGCLQNETIQFNDGLNIISLPNESGKSTIAEFIRVMLYGINSLRFNQRKQYMPFGHSVMGGEIEVEKDGTVYVICRSFGTRKSDDKIEVFNKETSAKIQQFCVDNVGEMIFGINGDTFENTCYIKQLSSTVSEQKSGEIQNKLINLSQSGSENYSYKNALTILDNEIRELSKPRGKINQTQGLLNDFAVKKAQMAKIKEEYRLCKEQLEAIKTYKSAKGNFMLGLSILLITFLISVLLMFITKLYIPFVCVMIVSLIILAIILLNRNKSNNLRMEQARQTGFYQSKLESLKTQYDSIDVSGYDEYAERLKRYNKGLEDLKYAKTALTQAFEEMQKDYSPKLNGIAGEILRKVTNGRYKDFMVDENFEIQLRDSEGRLISSEYLSKGTYDQIYFALRMALAEMIAYDVPLVMDDSFALYDDQRLKTALSYLKSIKRQVILFSCHSREIQLKNVD